MIGKFLIRNILNVARLMASSIIWNWKLLYNKHNFPFYLLIIELLIQKKPIVSLRLCANWAATPNLASRWCFLKWEILEVENYFFMKTHDCSHEIKRRLLLGRKFMMNLDIILKSRDITLPSKVQLVKAMVFPVVMYGCELMLLNCGVGEDSWESLGLQGDPTSPS